MEDNIEYNNFLNHFGHDVFIVKYGTVEENGKAYPLNIALECEDCNEVIESYDRDERKWVIWQTNKSSIDLQGRSQ